MAAKAHEAQTDCMRETAAVATLYLFLYPLSLYYYREASTR